jgi:hypothetical protein
MRQGFLYLVAIIDWATRRVLSWRLLNTLTAGFCVETLSEALARFGIFPCEGGRDEDGERALGAAFDKGGAERVIRLYRRDDLPEDQCWLRAPGWCLAYR